MTVEVVTCKSCDSVTEITIVKIDNPKKPHDTFCPLCTSQHVDIKKIRRSSK